MLNAYLDSSGWAKLVAHGDASGSRSDCSNMWLVHKPEYEAFVRGYFNIHVIDGSVSDTCHHMDTQLLPANPNG